MNNELLANLDKIHTTELGKERITQNLKLDNIDVVSWCKQKIKKADTATKIGKNWYVYADNVKITINAHSFTIITVHLM